MNIGRNVAFGGSVLLFGTAEISVGDNTIIGYGTIVHTSTHDYELNPMWAKRVDRPVDIGKNVWIGAGAIILPGVKVQDYAVVGAGAVVCAHVPRGAIVAGNPARVLRYRDLSKILSLPPTCRDMMDAETINAGFLPEEKVCKSNDV